MNMPPGLSNRAVWAAGQPISALMSQALAHPELISLAAGFVDGSTLPVESTRVGLERLLSSPSTARAALQYGTTPGEPRLRDLVLQRFLQQDGIDSRQDSLSTDEVVITAGSNQLIHLVLGELTRSWRYCPLCSTYLFSLSWSHASSGGPCYWCSSGLIGNDTRCP